MDKNHPACLEILFAAAPIGVVTTIINWRVISGELVHVLNDSGARLLFVGAELYATAEATVARVSGLERIIVIGGDGDEYESLLAAASPTPADTELVNHSANLAPAFPFAEGNANLVAMMWTLLAVARHARATPPKRVEPQHIGTHPQHAKTVDAHQRPTDRNPLCQAFPH
jgi:acyl-CoA synthetase (AMP-forming)/AMP-acid ligase II